VLGEHVVLEGDDARDGVDVARLELCHEPVEVLDDDRPLRARRERERHRGAVGDKAAIALDVDHHGVELGARHELEHPLADALVGDAVVGQVGGADGLGRERHGHPLGVRRQPAELIARDLDEEGRAGLERIGAEAAFVVGPGFCGADPDRCARQRRAALGVQHPPANRALRGRRRGPRLGRLGGRRGDLALEEQGGRQEHPARRGNRDERAYHKGSVEDGALCDVGRCHRDRIHSHL